MAATSDVTAQMPQVVFDSCVHMAKYFLLETLNADTHLLLLNAQSFRVTPETGNPPGRVVIFHIVKTLPNAGVVVR